MKEILHAKLKSCNNISDFLLFWLSNSTILRNKDTFDRYYRNYLRNFSPRLQKFYQSQSSEVAEMILQKKKPTLLDIGCGCGTETLWFTGLGAESTGIDVGNAMIEVARERKKILEDALEENISCQFNAASIFNLNPRYVKFDIIWMQQTFHHIEPREDLIPLLFTLLNDGGALIISESNAWNPFIQFSLLKRRGLKTIIQIEERGQPIPWGNERIITPIGLMRTLRRHGFMVGSPRYFRLLPSNKIFDKFSFLETIWPRALFPAFTHYNLVAQKPSSV